MKQIFLLAFLAFLSAAAPAATTTDRVDGITASVAVKAPVRVATTANITLSATQTIDGVAVVAEDRVLVKNQTTASENGIYVVKSTAWERAKDFDGNRDIVKGTLVPVTDGTTNSNTYWRVSASNPITIGTTSISFERGAGSDGSLVSFAQSGSSVTRTVQERLRDTIHVRDFVTGGSGTEADPWTGWCSGANAITWARGKTYYFSNGWYSCASTLSWRLGGMHIIGESSRGAVIKHTGTGNIVELDGGLSAVVGLDGTGQHIENIRFVGNVNTTNCFYVRNTHHFVIKDVRCNDFADDGIVAYFSIHALIENFVVSSNEGLDSLAACNYGIRLIGDATYGFTGSWTIINPIISGICSQYGIDIGSVNASNHVIINGAAESNTLGCIRIQGFGQNNKIHGLYCNGDVLDNGLNNQWHGLTGGGHFKITTGVMNRVYGGLFVDITVGAAAQDNQFIGATYAYGGSGTFTDSGVRTQKFGVATYSVTTPSYDANNVQGSLGIGTVPTSKLHVIDNSASVAGHVRQNGAGDLLLLADGATERFRFSKAGVAQFGSGTEPTCNSSNRGAVVLVQGGAGVADTFRVCTKDAADAYAYRALF